MIEAIGDMWTYPANARCVTTNGVVKKNGAAVMGGGVALQAVERFPGIEYLLGKDLQENGLRVVVLHEAANDTVIAFPTKVHWRTASTLDLVVQSCKELVVLTDERKWDVVVLPRPGCGLGLLEWCDVRAAIETILDDRFHILARLAR